MTFKKHEVDWTHDKIRRYWDYISNNDALRHHFFGMQVGEHVATLINRKVRFKNFKNILDLSCGRGDILEACLRYLNKNQHAYATDFSEENVKYVNARFKERPAFRKAVLLQDYPSHFTPRFFDFIMITEVVEHLNDEELASMLTEASRLLNDDGYIFITTPNNENLDQSKIMCPDCGCIFHQWQHIRKWTPISLQEKLEQFHFQSKFVSPISWGSPLIKRLALDFAVKMNLLKHQGIVYIGRKGT